MVDPREDPQGYMQANTPAPKPWQPWTTTPVASNAPAAVLAIRERRAARARSVARRNVLRHPDVLLTNHWPPISGAVIANDSCTGP